MRQLLLTMLLLLLLLSRFSCVRPTLRNPMDCSPPGSSAHGIFQARVLEWGAIAFSNRDFNSTQTKNFQMFKLLEKAEEPEITLPLSIGSLKKHKSSRKTSTSAL